jgi:phospholipid/cholesterol/gamma-HCH transport system ATP-binding protein
MAEDFPIVVQNLHKSFGSLKVLKGLDFSIPRGEIFVVMGVSGSGKSVFLKHLLKLLEPDEGEILIEGKPLSRYDDAEFLSYLKRVGVVFQNSALFDSLTTGDNVAFPLREHSRLNDAEIGDAVEHLLERVGLSGVSEKYPSELSGGMRKRVGIARALALNPDFLYFDEPTSGLDPMVSALIEDLVLDLHQESRFTGIVITHSLETARKLGNQILLLWQGKSQFLGKTEDFFRTDDPIVNAFIRRDPRLIQGAEAWLR